jgi:hypothetical protein
VFWLWMVADMCGYGFAELDRQRQDIFHLGMVRATEAWIRQCAIHRLSFRERDRKLLIDRASNQPCEWSKQRPVFCVCSGCRNRRNLGF